MDQVEQFIDIRQTEYLSLCDRVLLQPEHTILRQFLRKHFAGDLFQQFALVKIRTDLLHFIKIQPLDLVNPLDDSLTLT